MKFAKELEHDLVPEWRAKYFDYKQGKKRIKAVTRAIRSAQRTTPNLRNTPRQEGSIETVRKALRPATLGRVFTLPPPASSGLDESRNLENGQAAPVTPPAAHTRDVGGMTRAVPVPQPRGRPSGTVDEVDGNRDQTSRPDLIRVGSIIGTPPTPEQGPGTAGGTLSRPATLNLPGPAMEYESSQDGLLANQDDSSTPRGRVDPGAMDGQRPGSAYEVGTTKHPAPGPLDMTKKRLRRIATGSRSKSFHIGTPTDKPRLARFFSPNLGLRTRGTADVPLGALEAIDTRNTEFNLFLEQELLKIETFYKSKEDESTTRLEVLKEQLHILRDQRRDTLQHDSKTDSRSSSRPNGSADNHSADGEDARKHSKFSISNHLPTLPDRHEIVHHPVQAAKQVQFRRASEAPMLSTPEDPSADGRKDYERKRQFAEVTYRAARRKLKSALQEFYRGLELLKAYTLLNRTAFRKINKKYDKAVNASPPLKFMYDRVNNAYFIKSNLLENYLGIVEDLYARYFENGNHKVAVNKLRKKVSHQGDFTASSFRSGLLGGLGLVFGIEGLVYALELLYDSDPVRHVRTSYLLQLYAGYFAFLLLFLLFCLACKIFKDAKVNYVFVFEFDTRHNLDWWQLSEIPSLCLFLLGFIMWMNFSRIGGDTMYIYYPVILIGVTLIIIFLPAPILYHRGRKWFLYSMWRLVAAPCFPVEFRDFFLGDMFCSHAFAMGNIELFFCLYAHHWNDPPQCNSSHSQLLGFFSTLPGIWRLLQCFRRYYDTRNSFPHLANAGKYGCTILYYMTLSIYRINRDNSSRGAFIFFALINSLYTMTWDVVMDWSLLHLNITPPLLRPQRAYKWTWAYYVAMILDPILRSTWVFYAAFPLDSQHSTLLSFIIAMAEVVRRGIWTVFRVENEHCTNVGRFRASRDTPLPYRIKSTDAEDFVRRSEQTLSPSPEQDSEISPEQGSPDDQATVKSKKTDRTDQPSTRTSPLLTRATSHATGTDLERATTRESIIATLRRRNTRSGPEAGGVPPAQVSIRQRVGTILHKAHAQDFQRRRSMDDDDDIHGQVEDSEEEDEEDYHQRQVELLPSSEERLVQQRNAHIRARDSAQDTNEEDDDDDDDDDVEDGEDIARSRMYKDSADRAGVA